MSRQPIETNSSNGDVSLPLNSQYVIQKNGIPKERVINTEEIALIEDLIKCSICFDIIYRPYECEICGSLFCEDCIKNWLKVDASCPMRCQNFKIIKARPNTRKLLNLINLRCFNYPKCDYTSNYWTMLSHEKTCSFQKIQCPNEHCNFMGCYPEFKTHMLKDCEYRVMMCGFCCMKIAKKYYSEHLESHKKNNTFYLQNCYYCKSSQGLCRCVCKKSVCRNCIKEHKNIDCIKNCYLFDNNLPFTTQTYNISKYPLPKNFEVKLKFNAVNWIRVGITFDKNIINDQTDVNCPNFDIYYILEDLFQFYTLSTSWKNVFYLNEVPLQKKDIMTITLKNGELKYEVNGIDLKQIIKVNVNRDDDIYLLVHCRNDKSKCEIMEINEIFNTPKD